MARLFCLLLLALAACSKPDNANGPGGVSMGEARALDEAAEMIEASRLPEDAMPPVSPASPPATGPSRSAPAVNQAQPAPART